LKKKFQVVNDLTNVQKTSREVISFLEPLSLSEAAVFDIRLCLEEALINAMKYGNGLRKDSSVDLEIEYNPEEVRLTVQDQGAGFDPKKLEDCTVEKNLFRNSGRGVYLIHQLMDEVKYNEKGNRLVMVKLLKNAGGSHGR
jgi:serine/threonine-protein kinase RsbW